jgi:hypothetical protein
MKNGCKLRIMIVSGVVPSLSRGGGCLALHRHFCERDDFAVAACGYETAQTSCSEALQMTRPKWWSRAKRTRVCRILENADYLVAKRRLPRPLLEFARKWQPNLIFGVADDLHTPMAFRLARTMRIPIALNFQDLFACSAFVASSARPFPPVKSLLLKRYHDSQARADAVFHTSDGMKEWFGPSARGDVLYPIGAAAQISEPVEKPPSGRLKLVYAGNCYGAYGALLLRLACAVENTKNISLEIFTMGNDWPQAQVTHFSHSGTYKGYLPFSELKSKFREADMFLTAMSFARSDKTFVQTSFTTKWLDYAPCSKPIVVWAPHYSSAARFAYGTGAGLVIEDDDPKSVIARIQAVRAHPEQWSSLARGACNVAKNELNADRLHNLLNKRLSALV